MFCPNCGKSVNEGVAFCENCGARVAAPKAQAPVPPTPPTPPVQKVVIQQPPITKDTLPPQFRPLSAWAYFGYSLLFSIPIVGFIFLIVFSFSGANVNRRSFARSYWCGLLLLVAFFLAVLIIAAATGGIAQLFDRFSDQFASLRY